MSPATVRALRLADGKLRLREILTAVAEDETEADPQALARTVLNDIVTLLYDGKLAWQPAPLGRHHRIT